MSFDILAPFYDLLARTVFGKKLFRAKTFYIPYLHACKTLLIIGGGTGEALNYFLRANPALQVTFVEPSEGMIQKARHRLDAQFRSQVHFICGNHLAIPEEEQYDALTIFFVIDTMTNETNRAFFDHINRHLRLTGSVLVADFFPAKSGTQNFLTWIMYRFFKVTTGIEASKLPDYEQLFRNLPLTMHSGMSWQNGYIRSMVFQKDGSV